MSGTRWIFKVHKWLAVAVGLFTLAWFVSGVVLMIPTGIWGNPRPAGGGPAGPGYDAVTVTVPQAIAVAQAAAGAPVEVTGMGFRRVAGRLLYEVSTRGHGRHLVDAVAGEPFVVTEDVARDLVRQAAPQARAPLAVHLLREHDDDYTFGPLPVYRVSLGDAQDANYYVAVETGELRATSRSGRWRARLGGLHTFNFLRGLLPGPAVNALLIAFSAVGALMSLFGLFILWVQWRNWLARRRAA